MRKLLSIFTILIFISCSSAETKSSEDGDSNSSSENGYTVSGTFLNVADGVVYLERIAGQNAITKDTASMKGGQVTFTGVVDEVDFYRLRFPGAKQILFVLDNKEIIVNCDLNNMETIKFEGSKDSELFYELNGVNQAMQKKANDLSLEFQQAQLSGDGEKMKTIEAQFNSLKSDANDDVKEIISQNTTSVTALYYALNVISTDTDFDFLEGVSTEFKKTLPDNKYTAQLARKLSDLKAVAIGSVAPEIALASPTGETVALSSLRGKYVLIDFWASWCKPCRMENPNVVRMYKQFKGKDFEIFGVSLDQKKEKWIQAIQQDGIAWPQVSDLGGWGSSAAALYKVSSIPVTFLLDKEGKIIAKNLRGPALEQKLQEVLN